MWISGNRFWLLVETAATAKERLAALTGTVKQHEATIEWLRVHINRLEEERTLLLRNVYHAPVGTFEIAREPVNSQKPPNVVGTPAMDDDEGRLGILTEHQSLLEDMGDEEAGRQGIKLEADGVAVYTK